MKLKQDNEGINKNEGPKIYDLSFRELAEREELMVHQKDEMQFVTTRESPMYINLMVASIIASSKEFDIKNELTRKKVLLYAAKLGCSIISHGDEYKNISKAYTYITTICEDEGNIGFMNLNNKFSVVSKLNNTGCPSKYNIFDKTKDWISSEHNMLGLSQGDLALYCMTLGFKRAPIPNALHMKYVDEALLIFERHMKARAGLLSMGLQ